ncbi:MAG TPA: SIMPL domain-containing protein [Candidatus Limnocylindrales bacterium]|nr:SIMPL domain-containing protein [Candidatus Limnocylindrales bacterium]
MTDEIQPTNATPNKQLNLRIDYQLIIIILLAVIIAMLAIWRPWNGKSAASSDRTVSVSGEATIKAEPDEYIFNPSYQFKNTDKAAALAELTKKSDELVSKIKALGIPDSNIKTGSSGYDYYQYYYDPGTRTNTYTLQLTVKAANRDQAQKVQDYLITTEPMGAVSPQANFSEGKRKQLESEARDKATKEARAKADQSAKNLGFKVGAVKSVNDGTGFGGIEPYGRATIAPALDDKNASQLSVQPGQNDLRYSVSVVYYLR